MVHRLGPCRRLVQLLEHRVVLLVVEEALLCEDWRGTVDAGDHQIAGVLALNEALQDGLHLLLEVEGGAGWGHFRLQIGQFLVA